LRDRQLASFLLDESSKDLPPLFYWNFRLSCGISGEVCPKSSEIFNISPVSIIQNDPLYFGSIVALHTYLDKKQVLILYPNSYANEIQLQLLTTMK